MLITQPMVYLAIRTTNRCTVRFVAAKTRVAPLQVRTIPRVELLSAVMLARLVTTVQESLGEEMNPHDSRVAHFWIVGQFVIKIRRLVPTHCWKHCPGECNRADLPFRGLSPPELSISELWRRGPIFLIDQP